MAVLLLILSVCSFLFYGVVGQDKTWLLAPVYLVSYAGITIALLKRAWSMGRGDNLQAVSSRFPISSTLWILFLLYGMAMIPQAGVPFESKLVTLFVGGVVGAYLIWGGELTTFKDNRLVLGFLVFVVMLCALYGLVVHFKSPDRVLWAERYVSYTGRLMSTYICPNHFAHLMQMLLPFCLALLFIPQAGVFLKILSAYSCAVFLPTLFFTESRAGWLGSIASVGIVSCLMALRRSRKLFAFLLILVPLCAILLLFGAWRYSETFQRRMQPVAEFLQGQADEGIGSESRDFRPQTWMDTIGMINEKPLVGFGPGNYRYTFPEYRNRCSAVRMVTGHPHNEYLELIADYGLVGFGLFALAWIYGCVWVLVKSLKAEETRHAFTGFAFLGAVAGTMVHSFFDFQMHVYPNALVFALLAAMAVGPLVRAGKSQKQEVRGRRVDRGADNGSELLAKLDTASNTSCVSLCPLWLRKTTAWLLAIAYLAGTGFCLQIMSSAFIRALGDKAKSYAFGTRREALGETAAGYYRLAAKVDPQNWRAYKGLGQLIHKRRYHCLDIEEKIQLAKEEQLWFEKAYVHNSKDPEVVSSLGKALLFLGRTHGARRMDPRVGIAAIAGDKPLNNQHLSAEALAKEEPTLINQLQSRGLELLREACRYRKFTDGYWWTLGVGLRNAERYEESLEVFQYASTLKRTPSIRKNISWLEQRLAGNVKPQTTNSKQQTENLHLQQEKLDLSEVLDLMESNNK